MKNFCILIASITLFLACNSGSDKQSDADTTVTVHDTVETFSPVDTSTEFIVTYSSNLEAWLNRTTRSTLRANLSSFQYIDNWVEDSLIVSNANLTPDFYKTYQSLLIFSPDSSKVLDMGSYGAMVSKDNTGKTHVVQGEPDAEIAVLDRATRKRRRIFFFGPGTSIDQGFWINDSTIVLAGRTGDLGDSLKPIIWTVSLEPNSNMYKRYEPKQ